MKTYLKHRLIIHYIVINPLIKITLIKNSGFFRLVATGIREKKKALCKLNLYLF